VGVDEVQASTRASRGVTADGKYPRRRCGGRRADQVAVEIAGLGKGTAAPAARPTSARLSPEGFAEIPIPRRRDCDCVAAETADDPRYGLHVARHARHPALR